MFLRPLEEEMGNVAFMLENAIDFWFSVLNMDFFSGGKNSSLRASAASMQKVFFLGIPSRPESHVTDATEVWEHPKV